MADVCLRLQKYKRYVKTLLAKKNHQMQPRERSGLHFVGFCLKPSGTTLILMAPSSLCVYMQHFTAVINPLLTVFTYWIVHHYHCYSMCVHSIIIRWVMISSVWPQDTGDTNSTPICFCLSCVCFFAHVCVWLHFSSLSLPPSYRHQLALCYSTVVTSTFTSTASYTHLTY